MRAILPAAFALLGTALAQGPALWTPEFALQFQTIGTVVPSPDGTKVAWTQTRAVMDAEHSEMLTQVWLAGADGSHRIQLTRGEKSATNPAFSPDGRWVYFTSERSGKNNVYRIPIAGGEAEMLTDFKGTLGAFQVSPDGKSIAFAGYEAAADEEKNRKEKRDWHVVDANPANHSLYLVPAEPGTDGKRAQRKLTDGKRHVNVFSWSPDWARIAFSHWPAAGADYFTKSDVAEVEVVSGAVKTIAATAAAEEQPLYSPDGRFLTFSQSSTPVKWAGEEHLVLMNRASGELRTLPPTYDEQPHMLGWLADSSGIAFIESKRTRTAIFVMPVDGPPRVLFEPTKGVIGGGARMKVRGTHFGLAVGSAAEAPEAYGTSTI